MLFIAATFALLSASNSVCALVSDSCVNFQLSGCCCALRISVLEVSSFCYYHCYYMHLVECTEQQAHFDAGELCQLLHNVQIWLRLWKLSIHAC